MGGTIINVRPVIYIWFDRSASILSFVRYYLSIDTVSLYFGRSILNSKYREFVMDVAVYLDKCVRR